MILYLKQSIEPGNLLFHVMDELGHPCYQVFINKHRFGKCIHIETTEQGKVADMRTEVHRPQGGIFQKCFAAVFL